MKLLLKTNPEIYLFVLVLAMFVSCKKEIKKEVVKEQESSRVDYLPYYNDQSFTPHWITPNSKEEKQFHKIPDFKVIKSDLSPLSLADLKGKRMVLNIFPSIDTGTCAASVKLINQLGEIVSQKNLRE